jgi:hypothetical protein
VIYVALAVFFIAGFAIGRWWALVVPLLGISLVYLGLDRGWFGTGLGDGWEYAAVLALMVAVVVTCGGVVAGRLARELRT